MNKRLVHQPALVYFRGHAAAHPGGPNGTNMPNQEVTASQCQPADKGEFW